MYRNNRYSFVDAHCDTLTECMLNGEELYDNNRHINLVKLLEYDAPVQVFSIWLSKKHKGNYYESTRNMIEYFNSQCEKYSDYISLTTNHDEIIANRNNHKICGILGVEGGEVLDGNFSNVENLYDLGVRIFTLTWNSSNELGHGAMSYSSDGLTDFGKKAVCKMNELGMIIDVSHLNESGFWDVYKINSNINKPFIASHSNSYEICNSPRNLTDNQIRAIADVNGVVGINLYSNFISSHNPDIKNLFKHIEHIINLVGENHLGFGCDFDGCDKLVRGVQNVSYLSKLFDLIFQNFGQELAQKIFFGNYMRIFSEVLK